MTDTIDTQTATAGPPEEGPRPRKLLLQIAVALACALLGFLLVAQVRATESLGERLASEREEDLARILADLSAQSDRLQGEITDLRLLLFEFQSSAESEELALRSLRKRLDDLQILAGTVAAEAEGVVLEISDPAGQVTQDVLVDVIQELRDAGAEAIAVNDVRLVASSAFTTRNERLLVDGYPLDQPYRIAALGSSETLSKGLTIPGGAIDTLHALPQIEATIDPRAQLTVPARSEPVPFVFAEPVPSQAETG